MERFFDIFEKSVLFNGIERKDYIAMMECMSAALREYSSHASIFMAGDPVVWVGLLLSGSAQVVRDDIFGNRTILTNLEAGDIFGETFACADISAMPVSVITTRKCEVLLIDYKKIVSTCPSSCVFHSKMIKNMMNTLAAKNLHLNRKIEVMSARTTREKLLVYLMGQANAAGSRKFAIPYNRQGLADYLSVDRSAMSAELGRMRDEGLLVFYKNDFELLGKQ